MTLSGAETCDACGGPMAWRQAHRYPVLLQILFAASFIGFLVFFETYKDHRTILWGWSAIQVVLGMLLVRGRVRAKHRVLRCIRCESPLR